MARVVLFSFSSIGRTMNGPGIRYWEFAKALSKNHDVTLLIPNDVEIQPAGFQVIKREAGFEKYLKDADVLISQIIPHPMAWYAKKFGVKIILDAYDPMPFETMEAHRDIQVNLRIQHQREIVDAFNFSFRMADFVICANEIQRDLWTGFLLSLYKIAPDEMSLRKVQLVPFGLSSSLPVRTGIGLRELLKLNETDKIALWGGSIANWFDPLSLIQAMHLISQNRSDIHLVFMGVQIPDISADSNIYHMSNEAQKLSDDLKLTGRTVHFNQSWIPYEMRTGFLLDADIGISTHFEHLETRYSFRTRMLDYIWAGLPIINTEGDSFSRLIQSRNLGIVVPYKNPQAIAAAIVEIIDNPDKVHQIKQNLMAIKEQFYWENVIKPIEDIISLPSSKEWKWADLKEIFLREYHERGLFYPLKALTKRAFQKCGLVESQ